MKNKRLPYGSAVMASLSRAAILTLATLVALCVFSVPWVRAEVNPATQGQIILSIDDQQSSYGLGPYTYVVVDPNKNLTPEDVLEKTDALYSSQRNVRRILDLGYQGEKQWLLLKVQNYSSQKKWLLNFGNTLEGRYGFVKSIDVYRYVFPKNTPASDDTATVKPQPVIEKLNGRLDTNIVLDIQPNTETLIMLAVQPVSGIPLTVDMKLMTKDFAILQQAPLVDPITMLMIFLCGMAFFFLSVGMSKQSWDHLPYAGYYVLLAIIFQWNNASIFGPFPIQAEMLPLLMGMLTVCSIGLTKVYLKIRPHDYFERYLLNGLAMLVLIGAVGALMPLETPGLTRTILFYGPSIATFLILPVLCFAQAQAGKAEAYPLIWAWFFQVTGMIITAAALAGFLKLSGLTINAFWLMLVPQSVFFAFSTLKKIEREQDIMFEEKAQENKETLSLVRLRHTKESAEQARLLKVIEREREILAQMREREIQRTEEMRLAKIAADEANRAKSAFLAVVSHEIRTPMTGIMGMVRLLLDSALNKDQKDYVLTIQDSGDSMLTLLNDILDFEKIQHGRMDLEQISFELPRLIQGVATLMSGHAAQKDIGLKTVIDENVPRFVIGDPNRLRQVLLNLAGNAIKFTSSGNVTIRVECKEPAQGTLHNILFSVQDSGIGISEEAQRNLFTPFSQADSSISRKFGGTGLGLAICKGLIEAMSSRIRVDSEENKGSTFYFILKMQSSEHGVIGGGAGVTPSAPAPVAAPQADKHILVVDDNDINLKVATGLLARIGCTTNTAQSAEQALRLIEENDYDLILMDIQLPHMKGDEATMVIRKMANPEKAKLPIIALSGNVMQEDIERFQRAGMSGFLAKPIDPDKLEQVIMGIPARKQTAAAPKPSPTPAEAAPTPQAQNEPVATPAAPEKEKPVLPAMSLEDMQGIFDQSMLVTLKDSLGKDQLGELLDGLLDKTTEIVAALQEASDKQDIDAIAARAHELKGMAGNFGLIEISDIASQAEKKARAKAVNDIGPLLSGLPAAKTRAESALASWIAS
jgi:signal transduction histidine kinase/CheY-like chemotaxis protein